MLNWNPRTLKSLICKSTSDICWTLLNVLFTDYNVLICSNCRTNNPSIFPQMRQSKIDISTACTNMRNTTVVLWSAFPSRSTWYHPEFLFGLVFINLFFIVLCVLLFICWSFKPIPCQFLGLIVPFVSFASI